MQLYVCRKQRRRGSIKAQNEVDPDVTKLDAADSSKDNVSRADTNLDIDNPYCMINDYLITSSGSGTPARSDPPDTDTNIYDNPGYSSTEIAK